MVITLANDFHGTETTVRTKDGRLTHAQVMRAKRTLCAKDCICSDYAGARMRKYVVQIEEQRYPISEQTYRILGFGE